MLKWSHPMLNILRYANLVLLLFKKKNLIATKYESLSGRRINDVMVPDDIVQSIVAD